MRLLMQLHLFPQESHGREGVAWGAGRPCKGVSWKADDPGLTLRKTQIPTTAEKLRVHPLSLTKGQAASALPIVGRTYAFNEKWRFMTRVNFRAHAFV